MASYDVIVKLVDQTKAGLRNIESGLTTVQSRAEQVNKTLDRLGTGLEKSAAIASAALTAAAKSAISFADNISDTAKAADMSTGALIGLSKAFELNGGTSEKAQQAALRFAQTVGDAAAGSDVARKALDKVGISLADIANVPTDQLLSRTVNELSNFGDQSKAASVSADIFGKTVKGVDFKGVNDQLAQLTDQSRQYEGAVASAADLVDNFSAAMGNVKMAILQAIKPAIDFINALGPERLGAIATGIAAIGGAIAALYLATKGASFITTMFAGGAGAIADIIKWMKGLTIATEAGTAAVAGFGAANAVVTGIMAANATSAAYMAGAIGRLGRAQATQIEAQMVVNGLIAQGTVEGAVYAKAVDNLTRANAKLALSQDVLVKTQQSLNTAMGVGTAETVANGAAAATTGGLFARMAAGARALIAAVVPISIALVAITAAITAGIVIYRAFEDEIDSLLGSMWDFAKELGSGIKDAITGFFGWVNDGLTSMAQGIRNVASSLGLVSKKDVSAVNYSKAPDQSAAETKRLAEASQTAGALREVTNKTLEGIKDAITAAKQSLVDLGYAAVDNMALAAMSFDKASQAALSLGVVLKKPADLIQRDFTVSLQKASEEIRQNGIVIGSAANVYAEFSNELAKAEQETKKQEMRLGNASLMARQFNDEVKKAALANKELAMKLSDAGLQQRVYTNEITAANLQLKDQEQRLGNAALQQALYANEVKKANLEVADQAKRLADATLQQGIYATEIAKMNNELKDQQQRLADTNLQQSIYNNELAKGLLSLQDQEKRLSNVTLQQGLFDQNVQKTRNDLQQQQVTLDLLNEAYAKGAISLTEYADALGGINTQLLGSKQLMAQALNDANKEIKTASLRKQAIQDLIVKYKEAGGTGTEAFKKAAEALGAQTPQIQSVVNQYGSYADKVKEYNQDVEDSINSASKTFVDEFTTAFMKGENMLDSFRNFFSNVMNDIAQRIIKKQLTEPIADALNGLVNDLMKSSGGIGSILGGIFSGGGGGSGGGLLSGIGGFLGDIASGIGSFFGFANGGSIGPGQVGIVGEKGPEFITGPANITPMDKMDTNTAAPNVTFTINAIDTQTGVQFLLQNKPAIVNMVSEAYNKRGRRGVNG